MSDIVVVIEDSRVQAERLREVLAEAGFDARVAHDGLAGIALAVEIQPAIVLTDVVMPGIDGIEVTRRLKALPALASMPVIVLTAASEPADVVRALDAGADNFVAKPYDEAGLVDRVTRTIRLSRDRAQPIAAAHQLLLSALEDAVAARQKADDANRAKDDFLATVSHELRTPLSAILGWAKVLRSSELDAAKQKRALEVIERNAQIQAQLIEDLLDVSRIASGQLRLEAVPVPLREVVDAAIDAVRPNADLRGIALECEIRGHPIVLGDPARLQQVVWNLLTNAIKFSERGGSVEVRVELRDGAHVITVSDHGRGIAPEQLPHVFERFRQAHRRGAGEVGLGLGLSIVRHIVERHGGTIAAHSDGVGHGASFEIELRSAHATSDGEARARPSLDGVRVLLVDDEPDVRELLAYVLRNAGAAVEVRSSAREALERVAEVDVILSDIAMPEMSGHELVRAIRSLSGERGGRTPAIALTAFGGVAAREAARDAGFDVHLTKPIEPDELVRVVSMVCRREGVRS